MSCKHGNWPPCNECDAEEMERQASSEYGFNEGIRAAARTICGQSTPPKRWRIEIGYTVVRDVDMVHFFAENNAYTDDDRKIIFGLDFGHTARVSKERVVTATTP